MVRNTVEQTLNAMLDAEADQLCNAEKYQRVDARTDTRALESDQMKFIEDRIKVAKYLFSLDAVLGILSIGGAALYGAAFSSGNAWSTFLAIFAPCAVLWSLFCYCAYKGLTSDNAVLKFMFWLFVVGHVFGFPVGTAISGVAVWLWRDFRKPSIAKGSPSGKNRGMVHNR